MKKITQKENIGITGTIRIKTYKAGTLKKVQFLYDEAKRLAESKLSDFSELANFYREIAKDVLAQGYLATPVTQKNLIMQSPGYGSDLIIQRFIGNNTYSLNILYCEIGTGNTAPAISDTALTTPVTRAIVSFQQDYATTDAILQFFFPDVTLPNQTYYEVGSFVDGSATLGSGQLFNHALLGTPYVKIAGQDTTISIDFSVS